MKKVLLPAVFAALLSLSAHAEVEINGDVVQHAELNNNPFVATAAGADAVADAGGNTIVGKVHISGDLTQTLIAKNSPIPATALGNRSHAEAHVNQIKGN